MFYVANKVMQAFLLVTEYLNIQDLVENTLIISKLNLFSIHSVK